MSDLQKIFSQIYDQNIDKIYRFIFLKVSSRETAEDLTSEAFTRAWEVFKESQGEGNNRKEIKNPSAFLYQIARNLVIDFYREKGKMQMVSAENASLIDPSQDLEEKSFFSSDIAQIRLALVNLNEDYQSVLIWHYLEDIPVSKISQMLDKSEDAVRVTLHRALKALKSEVFKKRQDNPNLV